MLKNTNYDFSGEMNKSGLSNKERIQANQNIYTSVFYESFVFFTDKKTNKQKIGMEEKCRRKNWKNIFV